ncbi:MAG: L,D-transpeptidase [Smithella sp.]
MRKTGNVTPVLIVIFIILLSFTCISFSDAWAAKQKITSLCRVEYPSDKEIEYECRRLKRGESPESLFGDSWRDVLRFNRIDRRHLYTGKSLKVPKKIEDIEDFTPLPLFYPDALTDPRFILVDLEEQFLGAYEYGYLVMSFPIASGRKDNKTPAGTFRITAFSKNHRSSLYKIEKKNVPYPMHYALRFFTDQQGVDYWIHGRDIPGYPASHGCIGLYDEEMQSRYYRNPRQPILQDAKELYEWVVAPESDDGMLHTLKDGPIIIIKGEPLY